MATEYVIGNVKGPQGNQGIQGSTGISVSNSAIDANGHLIQTLSDGTKIDAGVARGDPTTVNGQAGQNITLAAKDIGIAEISGLTANNTQAALTDLTAQMLEKATKKEIELFTLLDTFAPPEMHRTNFRGKNLGTVLTTEQKACVQDGTFKGLWLGDYWVIGGRIWRIVDIDYWYNCGDTPFTKHHLVIMPDEALYDAQMNETNITTGGYVGSKMYTTNIANAKTIATSAFGNAVLTHRELLVNAVTNGYPSGGSWYDSSVELPNECMMYGSHIFTPASNGSIVPYLYTIDKTQLALFQACPKFIVNRTYNQWLRDVVSGVYFATVYSYGTSYCFNASHSRGVRPVFPVG